LGNKIVEDSIFAVLSLAAFGMLIAVTGGILYLTFFEWRDRRRRDGRRPAFDHRDDKQTRRR
jgi:hypothetical protein